MTPFENTRNTAPDIMEDEPAGAASINGPETDTPYRYNPIEGLP